jgi:uncharacterized protein
MYKDAIKVLLLLTEDCNLRCKYCYIPHNPKKMSIEVIDRTIDLIEDEYLKMGNPVMVHLFGGEPMMERGLILHILNRLKVLRTKYSQIICTIFTNATLFNDEDKVLLAPFKEFLSFNLSIDGCKSCHNSSRINISGEETYDKVMEGAHKIYDFMGYHGFPSGKYVISPDNISYLVESVKSAISNGNHRLNTTLARDDIWDKESLVMYEKVMDELSLYVIEEMEKGTPIGVDLFTISILDYSYTSQSYCYAGKGGISIAPNGKIYPCQRMYTSNSKYIIGDVLDNGLDKDGVYYNMFKNYNVTAMKKCRTCDTFKSYNCLGQCIASAFEANGSPFDCIDSICEIHKITYKYAKRIEYKVGHLDAFKSVVNMNNFG